MRRRLAVLASAVVLLVSCGSDGITRPTLPNRTTTVPSSEPGATTPPVDTTVPVPDTTVPSTPEVTDPAATVPPATDAPTTVPATQAPTTAPPATAAPTTAAPTTAAPTTAAPTTEAPTTVPATDAVTTVPVTEPATTVDSVPGDNDGDGGTTWWPWVLLAVLAIGGLTALALRRRGPKWPQRVSTVLDELDGITAHLSAHTPEGLRTVAQADAAALAALRVRLRDLVAAAPDDQRAVLDQLTAPVADLHTAVGAVSLSPTIPTPDEHQAVVRAAAVVNTTSATVRISVVPPPPPPPPSA